MQQHAFKKLTATKHRFPSYLIFNLSVAYWMPICAEYISEWLVYALQCFWHEYVFSEVVNWKNLSYPHEHESNKSVTSHESICWAGTCLWDWFTQIHHCILTTYIFVTLNKAKLLEIYSWVKVNWHGQYSSPLVF